MNAAIWSIVLSSERAEVHAALEHDVSATQAGSGMKTPATSDGFTPFIQADAHDLRGTASAVPIRGER